MKNLGIFIIVILGFNNLCARIIEDKDKSQPMWLLISSFYGKKVNINRIEHIDLSNEKELQILFGEKYVMQKEIFDLENFGDYCFTNDKDEITIKIQNYATLNDIKNNGIEYYIDNKIFINYIFSNVTKIMAINSLLSEITNNNLGDIYNYTKTLKKIIRGNAYIEVRYRGSFEDANSEELFQLAKKIDHKICELNGIPYDPNFPEKEDNDSEEDKEVKRKIADGTYKKIEDLPKPQSQNSDVKDLVKNPEEEKKNAKTESPIFPKIENSKSKIFIIFGILLAIISGGFLMIYKKCKKKNNETNNETNN